MTDPPLRDDAYYAGSSRAVEAGAYVASCPLELGPAAGTFSSPIDQPDRTRPFSVLENRPMHLVKIKVVVPEGESVKLDDDDLKSLYPYLAEKIPERGVPAWIEVQADGAYLTFRVPVPRND